MVVTTGTIGQNCLQLRWFLPKIPPKGPVYCDTDECDPLEHSGRRTGWTYWSPRWSPLVGYFLGRDLKRQIGLLSISQSMGLPRKTAIRLNEHQWDRHHQIRLGASLHRADDRRQSRVDPPAPWAVLDDLDSASGNFFHDTGCTPKNP